MVQLILSRMAKILEATDKTKQSVGYFELKEYQRNIAEAYRSNRDRVSLAKSKQTLSFVPDDTQTRWTVLVAVYSAIFARVTVARSLLRAQGGNHLAQPHGKRKRKSCKFDNSTFPPLSQRHSPLPSSPARSQRKVNL